MFFTFLFSLQLHPNLSCSIMLSDTDLFLHFLYLELFPPLFIPSSIIHFIFVILHLSGFPPSPSIQIFFAQLCFLIQNDTFIYSSISFFWSHSLFFFSFLLPLYISSLLFFTFLFFPHLHLPKSLLLNYVFWYRMIAKPSA